MSRPFKQSFIVAAVIAVLFALVDVVLGGRNIPAIVGASLIVFAVVLFVAFIVTRIVASRRRDDEYEYEDD